MQNDTYLFRTKKTALIGLIGVVCAWGFDFVALDYILEDASAPVVTFWRMLVTAVISLAYVLIFEKGWHLKKKSDGLILAGCGVVFMGIYYTLESIGISLTSGAVSSLLMALVPVFGMFADRIIYKRKITGVKALGILGTVAGVGMIVMGPGADRNATPAGVAVMLICCLIWTTYIVVAGPYSRKCSLMGFLSITFSSATVTSGVICLVQANTTGVRADFTGIDILLVLTSSIICMLLCEVLYVSAIRLLSVTTVSLAGNLLPIATMIISFFVFGRTLSALQLAGGAVVILSVCIITAKE
ncbi:MAG: DMT family transporter [Anaerovoracaceae bacterium]|jgi:drug/metabolite transporter (DMT)-like permease